MTDAVTLVISGKLFPRVPKLKLTKSSSYFSSLLNGDYADSHKSVYKFPKWSTKAFDFLLHYIMTGRVVLKGQRVDVIKKSMEISEFLDVHGFKSTLSGALVDSWTDMEVNSALRLADDLGVREELEETSLLKFLGAIQEVEDDYLWTQAKLAEELGIDDDRYYDYQSALEQVSSSIYLGMRSDRSFKMLVPDVAKLYDFVNFQEGKLHKKTCRGVNIDILILITGMERFWKLIRNCYESHDLLWKRIFLRYQLVLNLSIQLNPSPSKAKALARNLRLQILDECNLNIVLRMLNYETPNAVCLQRALRDQVCANQKEMRSVVSSIRFAFETEGWPKNRLTVAEFNLNTWCWKIVECFSSFWKTLDCVMTDKYSAFLGSSEIVVIACCSNSPKFFRCKKLQDILPKHFTCRTLYHAVGKYIFIASMSDITIEETIIYKFDTVREKLTACFSIPIRSMQLGGHGDKLYVVGHDLHVVEYKIQSGEVSVVPCRTGVDFPARNVLVIGYKIYIFSDKVFAIIDTLGSGTERFISKPYVGVDWELFSFGIEGSAHSSKGIVLLLHVRSFWDRLSEGRWNTEGPSTWELYNCELENGENVIWEINWDMMVARLNPETGEMTFLGILPKYKKENNHFQSSVHINTC